MEEVDPGRPDAAEDSVLPRLSGAEPEPDAQENAAAGTVPVLSTIGWLIARVQSTARSIVEGLGAEPAEDENATEDEAAAIDEAAIQTARPNAEAEAAAAELASAAAAAGALVDWGMQMRVRSSAIL